MGIPDPVTRESHGTGDKYYTELARQLAIVLENPVKVNRRNQPSMRKTGGDSIHLNGMPVVLEMHVFTPNPLRKEICKMKRDKVQTKCSEEANIFKNTNIRYGIQILGPH